MPSVSACNNWSAQGPLRRCKPYRTMMHMLHKLILPFPHLQNDENKVLIPVKCHIIVIDNVDIVVLTTFLPVLPLLLLLLSLPKPHSKFTILAIHFVVITGVIVLIVFMIYVVISNRSLLDVDMSWCYFMHSESVLGTPRSAEGEHANSETSPRYSNSACGPSRNDATPQGRDDPALSTLSLLRLGSPLAFFGTSRAGRVSFPLNSCTPEPNKSTTSSKMNDTISNSTSCSSPAVWRHSCLRTLSFLATLTFILFIVLQITLVSL